MMFRKAIFILVVIALLLVSCAGASMESQGMPGAGEDSFFNEEADLMAPMEPQPFDGEAAGNSVIDTTGEISTERLVIMNADLAIITEDPVQAMDDIGGMAERLGGFVVESNLYQRTLSSGTQVPQANITIRVPVERLEEALSQIKSGAVEVESENISGQDVTSQYTDLQSRLRNLEAAEAQLQSIMDEARRTEDVLDVFNELVAVREQIEVIKGQMQYYEESAALSRISVSITADEAVQPIQVGGWQPVGVAKDAVEALLRALQFIGTAGIWFVICVLPIAVLIGLPLFFAVRAVIRVRKRRKAAGETNDSPAEDE